jgi:hypothetical protein
VDGNEVVIVSGLQAGQQVVSAGVHVLSPGQKVTIYNAPSKPSGSATVPVVPPAETGATSKQR